jgi:hypothetical protein
MDLVAISEQLYFADGAPQEAAAPGIVYGPAPPRSARGRERDYLFIHLTLVGKSEEALALATDLARVLRHTFYHTEGSTTAALRRALLDLNEQLLHRNLSSKGGAYEGAICCAALRGDELFTVQAGEALAYLAHNFGVERLTSSQAQGIMPLGRSAGIDIRFAYNRLQPGDMLLLADPRLAHLSSATLAEALVDTDVLTGIENLTALVAPAVGPEAVRLLLVELSDESPTYLSVISRAQRNPLATPSTPPHVPAATPAASASTSLPVPAGAPQREAGQTPLRERPATTGRRTPAVPGAGNDSGTATVGDTARRVASRSARGLSAFTAWLADFLARLWAPQREEGQKPVSMALPVLLSITIPLLVAVIVTSVYLQFGRVQQLAEIKLAMAQNLTLASESAADAAAARTYYSAVLELARQSETIRPGDAEVARMQIEAREQLDRLDGITRLSARLLHAYEESAALEAIVLREGTEGGIFTLDRANNIVYLHSTDDAYLELASTDPLQVVSGGQVVGSQVVGPVTDMLWRPQGAIASRDGLIMLDRTGVVFTYYPNFEDLRALSLGFSSLWQEPVAITDYSERLYVLDPGAGQVWKYFPQGEGFILDEADQSLFFGPQADLGAAVDLDIYSEDGSLVIVYADGRVRYYDTRSGRVQWDETILLNNGLNTPLVAPAAVKLIGRGLNASIFIADPGSGRIVQVSRGGTVLTQYRTADETGQELFAQMSEFDVAESPLRIFVVAGNKLYVVTQE